MEDDWGTPVSGNHHVQKTEDDDDVWSEILLRDPHFTGCRDMDGEQSYLEELHLGYRDVKLHRWSFRRITSHVWALILQWGMGVAYAP